MGYNEFEIETPLKQTQTNEIKHARAKVVPHDSEALVLVEG